MSDIRDILRIYEVRARSGTIEDLEGSLTGCALVEGVREIFRPTSSPPLRERRGHDPATCSSVVPGLMQTQAYMEAPLRHESGRPLEPQGSEGEAAQAREILDRAEGTVSSGRTGRRKPARGCQSCHGGLVPLRWGSTATAPREQSDQLAEMSKRRNIDCAFSGSMTVRRTGLSW